MKPKVIFALFAIFAMQQAAADLFWVGDLLYKINEDGKSVNVVPEYEDYFRLDVPAAYWSLSGEVVIPSEVTYINKIYPVTGINNNAFGDCTEITSIYIPNTVTTIGEFAFSGCYGLITVEISDLSAWCKIDFTDPDSNPLYYARHFFLNGNELTNITIPSDIQEIKDLVFIGHTSMKSVTIHNSVSSIGNYAFYNCSGLTSLTIGSSVAKIGEEAFGDCSGLKDIYSYIKQPEKVTMGRWVFNDVPTDECVLHVPKGTIPIYRECNQWKNFTNIVEMTVTGDLNGDELVDVSDVNMLIDMVLGKAEKDIGKADLNGDGIVDVSDVNAMIDIVLGRD